MTKITEIYRRYVVTILSNSIKGRVVMRSIHSVFLRLSLTIICLFALSAFVGSWLSSHFTNKAMFEQSKMHLEAALKSRATIVEEHFRVTQKQVANLAADTAIIEAVQAFTDGMNKLEIDISEGAASDEQIQNQLEEYYSTEFAGRIAQEIEISDYLPQSSLEQLAQWIYIVKNPNAVGNKHEAYTPAIATSYQRAHDQFHTKLNRFLKSFDFYDVFLFDDKSRLVYSTRKETDFATDFNNGPYATSNLGNTIRTALASERNTVITSDLKTYAPSYFEPASFFASPVFNGAVLTGAVAFQISNEKINRIVADNHGLRGSGETYIVGTDLLMRTDSRFSDTSTILLQKVNTEASRAVTSGQTGSTITPDYRGVSVLSQYRPLSIDGLNWGMLAEIDEAEVREPSNSLTKKLIGVLLLTLAIVGAITYTLFRLTVVKPLSDISFTARQIVNGDYSARTSVTGKDEFSLLAQSQNQMAEAAQSTINDLEAAIKEMKELKGLLPICAFCKSIRDDDGYFRTVETYLVGKSNLEFSHTFCDQCLPLHYPDEIKSLPENNT